MAGNGNSKGLEKARENFENRTIEEDMPFILEGLEEKEAELERNKESGEISCDLDNPEDCLGCGS